MSFLGRFACALGIHAWFYAPSNHLYSNLMKCGRCSSEKVTDGYP